MAGYGDDSGFASWLADNGYSLPVDAPTPAVLRQRGSVYVDSVYGPRLYCSLRTGGIAQERAWPRTGHIYPQAIPDDAIPADWINAAYRAGWLEASQPGFVAGTLNPATRVKRQKVDVIEREFFDGGGATPGGGGIASLDAEIDGMLTPYLCPADDGAGLGIWSIGS